MRNDELQSHHMWVFVQGTWLVWIFVPIVIVRCFQSFLSHLSSENSIWRDFDSSPSLFSESLDSPFTWEFIDDVWELPCTMFEDFNIPFHGVLLDPLIEDFCGPLINYDSCSTFDETSPFLASPCSATFNGEY
jgi:hypothetical protein